MGSFLIWTEIERGTGTGTGTWKESVREKERGNGGGSIGKGSGKGTGNAMILFGNVSECLADHGKSLDGDLLTSLHYRHHHSRVDLLEKGNHASGIGIGIEKEKEIANAIST